MAADDSSYLEALKTARDAIVAAIEAGRLTVSYSIRGRRHDNVNPVEALNGIETLIEKYSQKVARANSSPYRVVSLSRPACKGD